MTLNILQMKIKTYNGTQIYYNICKRKNSAKKKISVSITGEKTRILLFFFETKAFRSFSTVIVTVFDDFGTIFNRYIYNLQENSKNSNKTTLKLSHSQKTI